MTSTGPAVVVPQNTVATETKKQPPPEPLAHQRRRMVVVFSFWAVVLFLGIPIWWKLTAIHRAALPLEQMQQWSDGRACRPVFPLQVSVRASSISDPDAETLVRLTQHAIDDLNDFSGHHLRLQLDSLDPAAADSRPAPALTIDLKPGDSISANLDSHTPVLSVTYPPSAVPSHSAASSSLATYIASELQATFAEERAILLYLTSEIASPNSRGHGLSAQLTEALDKRTTRLLQYAPTYHLTFSLFTAGATPNGWDVESAIRQYIEPMLTVLKPIHNFTIDTQVQLYSPPGVHSPVLGKEDLSSFINGAEWSLPPAIGEAPTINFILFVGNQTIQLAQSNPQSEPGTSQSWLIPKWGSVYLLPLPSDVDYVPADILKDPMLTFTGHLLSLLGTPQSGSLPLRLSTLSRVRSADLLKHASSSLGSLARLSQALTSISIPQSVADGVSKSLFHLEKACSNLGSTEALEHARIADAEAERAFFEKSMVGQLYFPDEHKIAVYLPLLGPVGTALFMGLISEVKAWKKRRREKTLAKAQKSQ
ncbi:GPI transamidase component PIG-S -like protein [Ceratocystis lukuohia]|uniref:GPI transamidase component PIG-S -like protein n=1 Tax=Ceratocystis lukuohia TaxID=2019550 RepID=A0ABR4MQE5_9PEZI